jgi:hypothetical protein
LALNTKDSLRDLFVRKWSFVFRFEFDHLFIGVPSVLICGRLFYSVRDSQNNFAVAYRNTANVVIVPVISDIVS